MKGRYRPAQKTYEIAVVETTNIMTSEKILSPYYKVYSREDDGGLMFEGEFETLNEVYDYIFKEKEDEQDTDTSS